MYRTNSKTITFFFDDLINDISSRDVELKRLESKGVKVDLVPSTSIWTTSSGKFISGRETYKILN